MTRSTASAMVILAMLPVATFSTCGYPTRVQAVVTAPIAPKKVKTENIRMAEYKPPRIIDRDIRSFEERWLEKFKTPVYPKQESFPGWAPPVPRPRPDVVPEETLPSPPVIRVRRASLRLDICARHGLRKVTYSRRGYQSWRCRR